MEQHKVGACKAGWLPPESFLISRPVTHNNKGLGVASLQADMWHDKSSCISSAHSIGDLEKNQNVMNGGHEQCSYPRSTAEKESGEPLEDAINQMDVSSQFSPMTSAITKT